MTDPTDDDLHAAIQRFHDLICANATIKAAQMAAEAISESAPQQDGPVGEVVSASCDHATVRWLHQTSSVGGGDPRNSRAWPKVSGVSRDEGHSRALLVFFAAEPTDDEVRAVHDTLAAAPTAQAAPVKTCVCGEPQASGTVHRVDGPCYVAAPRQEA